MLTQSVLDALNQQVAMELHASNLYLAMSAELAGKGLTGFGHWMRMQSNEEREHALRFADYIGERGGQLMLLALAQTPSSFGEPVDIFSQALAHERKVSASINNIYALASKEADFATQNFLQWFIGEQVEEEANAGLMVDRLTLAGDDRAALLLLDQELKSRGAE